jgi:uncharacterized RDD family membrane protein YckC
VAFAAPTDLPYANFWPRVWATLIDGIIVLLGSALLTVIAVLIGVGLVDEQTTEGKDTLAGIATAVFLIAFFIGSWLYTALYESGAKQATPGKRALELIVADEQGERISFARATARYFSEAFLTGNTLFIGYLTVLWTAKKQTIHDLICRTVVIRRP